MPEDYLARYHNEELQLYSFVTFQGYAYVISVYNEEGGLAGPFTFARTQEQAEYYAQKRIYLI
jgi:hypothetical protein